MVCSKASKLGWPCGQCLSCRINKKRAWVARLELEHTQHEVGCFVTLTYRDEDLPSDGSVSKREMQLFLKRLRKYYYGSSGGCLRYFAVGEYGRRKGRAHYHVLLFGLCPSLEILESLWKKGSVHTGPLFRGGAAYVAGYCLKKLTKSTSRPDKRFPEFALMSRKPGLGANAAAGVAAFYNTEAGLGELVRVGEQREVRINGQVLPLDRYMRQKVADAHGHEFSPLDRHFQALRRGMDRPLESREERDARRRSSAGRAIRHMQRQLGKEKL